MGFRSTLRKLSPGRALVELAETDGLDTTIHGQALAALTADPTINAVYSIGGGNRAIVQAFADLGRQYRCFVAHDLDADNLALLRTGALSVVLNHDLPTDLHRACQHLLHAHRLLPNVPGTPSNLHPITPYNVP
jgi:LacI family transcriptional regulator